MKLIMAMQEEDLEALRRKHPLHYSDQLGIVVSELAPEEMDRQEHTLDARQGATRDLELAVFAAA